jgi:hypothetical protein
MNELKNELKVELSCGRCNFTKVITVNLDEDGVFAIPNKFCPNDLNELSRDVLRQFVSVPKKPDESTEDKTRVSDTVPKPAGILDVPKHGVNRPKKT